MRRLALLFSLASVWALTATASANAKVLFGDMNQANYADSNAAGTAQAFQFVANTAGSASDIDVYVNNGSTASTLSVGLYSDANGKPGSLVASGSLKSPKAKAWNDVKLGSSQTIVQGDGILDRPARHRRKAQTTSTPRASTASELRRLVDAASRRYRRLSRPGLSTKSSPRPPYRQRYGRHAEPCLSATSRLRLLPTVTAPAFAQAFAYQAAASGTTTDIDLYVNSGTTASKLLPRRLQRQWQSRAASSPRGRFVARGQDLERCHGRRGDTDRGH